MNPFQCFQFFFSLQLTEYMRSLGGLSKILSRWFLIMFIQFKFRISQYNRKCFIHWLNYLAFSPFHFLQVHNEENEWIKHKVIISLLVSFRTQSQQPLISNEKNLIWKSNTINVAPLIWTVLFFFFLNSYSQGLQEPYWRQDLVSNECFCGDTCVHCLPDPNICGHFQVPWKSPDKQGYCQGSLLHPKSCW